MIKVMYDIYQFCEDVHGGVYTYFANLIEELMLTGEIDSYFATEGNFDFKVHREMQRYISLRNTLRYLPLPEYELFMFRPYYDRTPLQHKANNIWWSAMTKLEARVRDRRIRNFFGKRVDVCHYTDHFRPRVSMPSAVTVHDLIWKNKPEYFTKDHLKVTAASFDFLVENSDHFITVSNKTKQDILRHSNVSADRISVTHLGVDSSFYLDDDDTHRHKLLSGLGLSDEPYFVCLATLEPRKNHLGILDAFVHLKKAGGFESHQLILIGPSGWKFEEIIGRIENSEVADSIHITGLLDQPQIRQLLNGAVALVFPSFDEGFGLPPVEAMACGTPVVSSRLGSLPEVLGDYAEYVDAYDSEDIARGMATLAKDYEYRRRLVRDGLEWIKQYDYSKTARKTIEVYEMLVDRDRKLFAIADKSKQEQKIFCEKYEKRIPEKAFKNPQCPQCGSGEHKVEYALRRDLESDSSLCRCLSCDLLYHSMHRQQVDESSKALDGLTCRVLKSESGDFSFELQKLKEHCKGGKLLDVGWNWPWIIENVRSAGFEFAVQELVPLYSQIGRQHFDLVSRQGELTETSWLKEQFDVVTLWDSFSAMTRPWETLTKIRRILQPGGLLFVSVPNYDSYLRENQRKNWPFMNPNCFPHCLTKQALIKMIEPLFDIVEIQSYESAEAREITGRMLSEEETRTNEQNFRASNLLLVARKP